MSSPSKIVPFEAAPVFFEKLRAQGSRIVQCHGLFDLMHPGHISHLEEARGLGDVLVVTITADKFVNKGPGRPFFKEQLRANTLAALACVTYVVVIPHLSAAEAIEVVRPHIYCKGKDYENLGEVDQYFKQDLAALSRVGGQIAYVGEITFSATKLLNTHFDHLPEGVKDFCFALSRHFTGEDFRRAVESFSDLKVLVIGDTIFDRYSSLKVQGLTSKNKIISGRFLREETHCGGGLAVFRHVKQFVSNVKYLSLTGTEKWVDPVLKEVIAPHEDCVIRDPSFTTIIKQRFVEPLAEGKELSKLFSVNFIDADPPKAEVQNKIEAVIREEISKADVVLLLDFGHGMMQPKIRTIIQELAPMLVLNCQTNSNNHGFNIISRQYKRADAFALDENELMLSAAHRHLDFPQELARLQKSFGAHYAWLTRGGAKTVGLHEDKQCLCPALEVDVVDTVGAGDAFFSVAALAVARKLPINLATFLGQLSGAQAVKIVGNEHPISKQALLKAGMSLLNF